MNCQTGSIWRKWDLHIHSNASPDSALTPEEIVDTVIDKGINVFSITDHSSIENIDKIVNLVVAKQAEGYDINFFPGIELKTDKGDRSVHLVALFPVVDKNGHVIDLQYLQDNFLSAIGCTRNKLIDEGKKADSTLPDDQCAERGKLELVFDFEDVCRLIHNLGGLCVVHAGQKPNSIEREIEHEKTPKICELLNSMGALKEKLMTDCVDICELPGNTDASIKSRDFYLSKFNKPSVIGSDSHKKSDIGKKFTWIKADPTFEGLKQIMYEPKDRVSLQDECPDSDNCKLFFNSFGISGVKNFVIPDINLPLNRNLVTIIGGRGSGKSALLESIAFLNEEHVKHDSNGKEKLIEYYRQNIDNKEPSPYFVSNVILTQKDNSKVSNSKSIDKYDSLDLPFLYIGQEQLSSLATNEKELTRRICELISLDSGQLNSSELLELGRDIINQILNTSANLNEIEKRYSAFDSSNTPVPFQKWISTAVQKKKDQFKQISSPATKEALKNIGTLTERGLKLKDFKETLVQLLDDWKNIDLNVKIKELNLANHALYKEHEDVIPQIDLAPQVDALKKLITKLESEMIGLREKFYQYKKVLADSGLKEDVSVLIQSAETIQRDITNMGNDLLAYQKKSGILEGLVMDRNKIYSKIQDKLNTDVEKINQGYESFLRSRDESSQEEQDLFNNTVRGVTVAGAVNFNERKFCNTVLENFVDRRVIKTTEDIKVLIAGKAESGKSKSITLESLSSWISTGLDSFLKSDSLNANGQLKLVDYLFTKWNEFISVTSLVFLNDQPTEKLSVGQRGTLLLKIYLATATYKQIFIVDQPEDNLDNKFIMDELVPLIRQIKQSRQIILSTHNANLVVNADAEQVIIANLDGRDDKKYLSGSIENPSINQGIKDILEGGDVAFIQRENKYGYK